MTAEAVAARVEAFIRTRSRMRAAYVQFSRRRDLWEDGYMDSTGAVELIAFLEATFGVTLPDQANFHPDFTDVDGIAKVLRALIENFESN